LQKTSKAKDRSYHLILVSTGLFFAADSQPPSSCLRRSTGLPPTGTGRFLEGAAVFDVNNEGVLDITAGANGTKGPSLSSHPLREAALMESSSTIVGEYAYDVNGTEWTDHRVCRLMEDGIYWYENNHGSSSLWTEHKIANSTQTEGLIFEDVDGTAILTSSPTTM